MYRDNVLFDDGQQHVFVSEPVHNLVRHFELKRDGVSFKAERPENEQAREFLASRDPWFRPTMTKTGPDGSLYIADMYRLVIEHTEWIPDDVEQYLNTREGTDRGRIYSVERNDKSRIQTPKLSETKAFDLVSYLDHENGWVRDTAQRLLIESKADDQAPALKELLKFTDNPKARVHALWALRLLGHLDDRILDASFSDVHAEVRRNTLILSETQPEDVMVSRYIVHPLKSGWEILRDKSPFVRYQAMLTASWDAFENWKAKSITAAMHANAPDPMMRQASLVAASEYLRPMLSHVISCPECQQDGMLQPLMEAGLDRYPEWVATKVEQLVKRLVDVGFWNLESYQDGMRHLPPTEIVSFQSKLKMSAFDIEDHMSALSLFAEFLDRGGQSTLFASNPDLQYALQGFAMSVLAGFGELDASDQIHAFQFLWQTQGVNNWNPWMEFIFSLNNEIPYKSRQHILKVVVADSQPLGDAYAWFGKVWNQGQLSERRLLLALALNHRSTTRMFLNALKTGAYEEIRQPFDDTSLTQEMVLSLQRLQDPELRSLAVEAIASRRTRLGLTKVKSESIVHRFNQQAKLSRNTSKGQQLFQQNCQLCHRFHGEGAEVGPDLDALNDRSGLALLTAILNPNEAIEQTFVAHDLLLKDDEEWTVLITSETSSDMQVTMVSGEKRIIDKAEIKSIKPSTRSLMPEGWGEAMSDQDIADLIGYLQTTLN
jgi:putative heme-binding domain-containing protein